MENIEESKLNTVKIWKIWKEASLIVKRYEKY
jgi:hypothetical protein